VPQLHECSREGRPECAALQVHCRLAGRAARRAAGVGAPYFTEIENPARCRERAGRIVLDPRLLVPVRASDVDNRVADRRRRLACERLASGAGVWGEARQLDLAASPSAS